jgi:chaperonin GroES
MKIIPLSDRVVVKPEEKDAISKAGIILPPSENKEMPQIGEIIAIGDGRQLENGNVTEMFIKVGDKVIYSRYAGDEIELEGTTYKVMPQDSVLGLIQD